MAVPQALALRPVLAQLATDFLLPKAIPASPYNAEQVEQLWNPTLTGATEEVINTYLGGINVTHGGKREGPALVLWPSLMMRGSMWSYQYEHFRHTHRVVLIDSPGINKSDPLRKFIDLHDCSRALVEILDYLKIDKCIFGGNSWGAMLAAVLPAYFPERCLGTMVINGTASLPTTPEYTIMTIRTEVLMCCEKVPDWWLAVARSAFAGDTAEKTNPEFCAYIPIVSQEDPKSIAWALRSILLGRTDNHELIARNTTVPVLVIAGGEDRQFPVPVVKKIADAIPKSKFVVADGTGHLASRENPKLINREIEIFLEEIGVDH